MLTVRRLIYGLICFPLIVITSPFLVITLGVAFIVIGLDEWSKNDTNTLNAK